jgi:putative Mg2+ transporter-C (MgtC) family protein
LDISKIAEHLIPSLVAALCGIILGFERELRKKPAGIRSHILMCVGASIFTVMSTYLGTDRSRIAAQIVSGIGFLGGGAIVKEGVNVKGITTASNVWITGAIGIMCGAGLFVEAILMSLITIVILKFGKLITRWLHADGQNLKVFVSVNFLSFSDELSDIKNKIIEHLDKNGFVINEIVSYSFQTIQFFLTVKSKKTKAEALKSINESIKSSLPKGIEVSIKIVDQQGNLEDDLT